MRWTLTVRCGFSVGRFPGRFWSNGGGFPDAGHVGGGHGVPIVTLLIDGQVLSRAEQTSLRKLDVAGLDEAGAIIADID